MFGMRHHRACKANGVARTKDARYGAGAPACAIHDGGIHLVATLGVENRAAAGVEQWVVLKRTHSLCDSIEG